jgi:hypothetical protein
MVHDGDLVAAADELRQALEAAHVTSKLTLGHGWVQIQLWSTTNESPAPGLVAALHEADSYASSHGPLHSACVYPAQARWLADGLRRLVASGAAPR